VGEHVAIPSGTVYPDLMGGTRSIMNTQHPTGQNVSSIGSGAHTKLERRVVQAAKAALEQQRFVTAIDVLMGVGWLSTPHVDQWRQRRTNYLERLVMASLGKISTAMHIFRSWAKARGLHPSETVYLSHTRDRHPLRFSKSGDPSIERAYRTHWVSPELSEAKRERLAEKQSRPTELVVILPLKEWTCTECSATGDLLFMEDGGPLCLRCADLDHLVFLAAGNAALTRRANKASTLSAVVMRFSRSRGRYERQGILVEEEALAHAEHECLADEEARQRRRLREAERRAGQDELFLEEFAEEFAREIKRLFPGCSLERAETIACRAAARGSDHVGRSAAGRALQPDAVTLAVVAAARHGDTAYDGLLMAGVPRPEARDRVRSDVQRVLDEWRSPRQGP